MASGCPCRDRYLDHPERSAPIRYTHVVIQFARTRIVLGLDEIEQARLLPGAPPKGVEIVHRQESTPSVKLVTRRANEVIQLLEQRGLE